MKKLILIALCLSACQSGSQLPSLLQAPLVQAQSTQTLKQDWFAQLSPSLQAYYASARGKTGLDLLKALSLKSNQAQSLDYREATAFLYQVAERSSAKHPSSVLSAYSRVFIQGDGPSGHKYKEKGDSNGDGKKGDSINTEHTWPQSFFGKKGAMRTDMHHLFATLSTPNSQRGHHPFGLASQGRVSYATASGSKLAQVGSGLSVFEPANPQKGDTARAVMYFYLRYHNRNIRQGDYRSKAFFIHPLPMFKAWMQADPVTAQDQVRHGLISQKQGNRNPFIDIPHLIDLIGLDTFVQIEENSLRN